MRILGRVGRSALSLSGRRLALFAMFGVLVSLLVGVTALTGSGGAALPQKGSNPSEAKSFRRVELPGKRTAISDTYVLPGGERETRIYEAPVNYRNSEGEWVPIQEGFKRAGVGIEDRSHPFEIHLPSAMGNGPVRFGGAKHWISFELEGSETAPAEIEPGGEVSYEVPGAETSLEYSTLPDGVKETIELASASSPATFNYRLSAASGITPELARSGAINFREKAGAVVAVIPAPVVTDSSSAIADSDVASYSLKPRQGGGWDLGLAVERSWLEEPGRTWPVTIDPTIKEVESPTACDIATNLYFGICSFLTEIYAESAAAGVRAHALISVNWSGSGVPAGAEIKEASVNLYAPSAAVNTSGVELRRVTQEWNTGVSWACAYGGFEPCKHPWTTPGGDFNSEGSEILTSERGSAAGWWEFKKGLAQVFNNWAGGAPAYGFILKLKDETGTEPTRTVGWYPPWGTEVSKRPYMRVAYVPKAPASSQVSLPTEGTTTARRLRLKAKWGQVGSVSGVTFEYRVKEEKEGKVVPTGFKPIPVGLVTQANGEPLTKWPLSESSFEHLKTGESLTGTYYLDAAHLSPELQKKGGPVWVRADFEGTGGVEGYSEPVEAIINRVTGSAHDAVTGVGPGTLDLETGNLSISRTDVSVPGFNSSLEFGRTYNTRAPKAVTETEKSEPASVLGPGWKTSIPVEEAGGSEFRNIHMVVHEGKEKELVGENCEEDEEGNLVNCQPEYIEIPYRFAWAVATTNEGGELPFEEEPANTFITPPEATGWKLVKNSEGNFELSDPAGDITTFKKVGESGEQEWLPFSINQPGGAGNKTRLVWEFKNKEKQLIKLIAPSPLGASCEGVTESGPEGCRALTFSYAPVGEKGERLISVKYLAPGNLAAPVEVAHYEYNGEGRLIAEWDPRILPPLKEQYTYEGEQLKELTPPGQKPWILQYGTVEEEAGAGRLVAVKRASLLASPAEATTTIAYNVPLTKGAGGPYGMGLSEVTQWGQTSDPPVEATAIFPPSEVPTSSPPTSWGQATIYYMDSEGFAVNTATPKGGGTSEPSISTTETDEFGNVVRELTPDNRLAVLRKLECPHWAKEPECERRVLAEQLSTVRRYNAPGTEASSPAPGTQMLEEVGPMHPVQIVETGLSEPARLKTVINYDECHTGETCWSGVHPNLPTKVTTSANPEAGGVRDKRESETRYDWKLRKPAKQITIMETGKPNIESVTVYNDESGLPVATRQPKEQTIEGKGGLGAGTTATSYFTYGSPENLVACVSAKYAGLPCRIDPAAQPEGTGQPKLPVKRVARYNALAEPEKVIESPGGSEVKAEERITTATYDPAGRQLTKMVEGGGVQTPMTETVYNPSLGLTEESRNVCHGSECGTPKVETSFGSSGSGEGKFSHPAGMAVTSGGMVWIVDENNKRLEKFNQAGEFQTSFGIAGTTSGKFNRPADVAVDASGNIWVVDAGNNWLQGFNEKGQTLGSPIAGAEGVKFSSPEGVAIANGHIWVTDTHNHRILEYSEAGVFLRKVGTAGTGAGQLSEPVGIAIGPGGEVWVSDRANQRIEEFTESGEFVRQSGVEGSGDGQFKHPDALDIDAKGHIWVVDQENARVQEFDRWGGFMAKFGGPGAGAEQLNIAAPAGILALGEKLWVSDSGNNRVEKWNPAYDEQATRTVYDALGRPVEYFDADGNITVVHYDVDGRTTMVSDSKGSQTYHYNETSGLLTSLEDSAAGTFSATYDADGNLVERGLPNGLAAKTSYNAVDEPIGLTYTKTSSTWYAESLERSIYGQILTNANQFALDHYKYDNASRLTESQETPTEGGVGCTSRAYTFDADSNRLSKTTRSPEIGGGCATTGGATKEYAYDAADRLLGTGLTYDYWGRITNLPAGYAGGNALKTEYFSNNMVASQTQSGITNSYELDATGRQRQRIQAGGVAGTEIFHYDGPADSPSWTSLGSAWSRNILGIGGELAAVQESTGTVTFKLTDIHGDVVETASSSTSATEPLAKFRFSEFGEPESGSAGRFGWLGGKSRRTELSSGVIQMGARSYIPSLGRFLTPDPIPGGSANPYDYADQDPINAYDLEGTKKKKQTHDGGGCPGCMGPATPNQSRAALATIRQRTNRIVREVKNAPPVVKRPCTAIACTEGWPHGVHSNTGLIEYLAGKAEHYVAHLAGAAPNFARLFAEDGAGCISSAGSAWNEDTELREAGGGEPEITYALDGASAYHAAAACVAGMIGM